MGMSAGRSAGFNMHRVLTWTWYVWRRNGSLMGINVTGSAYARIQLNVGSDPESRA